VCAQARVYQVDHGGPRLGLVAMNCRDRTAEVIGQLRRPAPGCMEHPAHPADGILRLRVFPGQNKRSRQVGHGKIRDEHRPPATVQIHLYGRQQGETSGADSVKGACSMRDEHHGRDDIPFLQKPFRIAELEQKIKQLISRRRSTESAG
jgi:hypothetical protein